MADEKYLIPENPEYQISDIRKLQDGDPASATDTFNPLIQKVLESIENVNKRKAELDENGKVPDDQLPPVGGHVAQNEPPENVRMLWIDTANGNILKFYNAETEAWEPASAAWS